MIKAKQIIFRIEIYLLIYFKLLVLVMTQSVII